MAGPDTSSAASISMSQQLFASGQLGGHGGHGSVSSIIEILFGKIGGSPGGPVSPFTTGGEGMMQAMNLMRMLFTISGGFFRSIVESIKAYARSSSSRLAGIVAQMAREIMGQGEGMARD